MNQPRPDWYPDPSNPAQWRYWDGLQWTERTAPIGYGESTAAFAAVPTTPDGVPLAGWWWRVLAYVIDLFILQVVGGVVSLPGQLAIQDDFVDVAEELTEQQADFDTGMSAFLAVFQDNWVWLVVPTLVVTIAYYATMWRLLGATAGKLAVGLRIRLRDQPGTLPWSAILIRLAVWSVGSIFLTFAFLSGSWTTAIVIVAIGSAFGWLNLLWPLWDPKRQALHDKAAGTNVVKIR